MSDENQKQKDRNPQVKGRRADSIMDSGLFRADSYQYSINDDNTGSIRVASHGNAPARKNRNDGGGVCPRT